MPRGNPSWAKGSKHPPGAGRRKLPSAIKLVRVSVALPPIIIQSTKALGLDMSAFARNAIVTAVERELWLAETRGVKV